MLALDIKLNKGASISIQKGIIKTIYKSCFYKFSKVNKIKNKFININIVKVSYG